MLEVWERARGENRHAFATAEGAGTGSGYEGRRLGKKLIAHPFRSGVYTKQKHTGKKRGARVRRTQHC
jgi:hypothetical protein